MEYRSLAEVRANPFQKPEPLIDGIVNAGELVIITGLWDSFKSRFGAEMARSIASGESFLNNFKVYSPGPALIVQKEIHPGAYDERFITLAEGVDNSRPFLLSYDAQFRFNQGYESELGHLINSLGLKLIVFDPLTYFWPEGKDFDENTSGSVAAALGPLLRLRTTGCTFVLIHHDPKPSGGYSGIARGSSVLVNAPDTRILLARDNGADTLNVFCRTRNIRGVGKFQARLTETGRLVAVHKLSARDHQVREEVRFWRADGLNTAVISQIMNIPQEEIEKHIDH